MGPRGLPPVVDDGATSKLFVMRAEMFRGHGGIVRLYAVDFIQLIRYFREVSPYSIFSCRFSGSDSFLTVPSVFDFLRDCFHDIGNSRYRPFVLCSLYLCHKFERDRPTRFIVESFVFTHLRSCKENIAENSAPGKAHVSMIVR